MNNAAKIGEHVARHLVASSISLPSLLLIWTLINPFVGWLITHGYSGGFENDSGMFLCCCSLFYLFIFVVLSSVFDILLVKTFSLRFWIHIPVFVASVFLFTCSISLLIDLLIGHLDFRGVFMMALDYSLWGGVYWSTFVLAGLGFHRLLLNKGNERK